MNRKRRADDSSDKTDWKSPRIGTPIIEQIIIQHSALLTSVLTADSWYAAAGLQNEFNRKLRLQALSREHWGQWYLSHVVPVLRGNVVFCIIALPTFELQLHDGWAAAFESPQELADDTFLAPIKEAFNVFTKAASQLYAHLPQDPVPLPQLDLTRAGVGAGPVTSSPAKPKGGGDKGKGAQKGGDVDPPGT